MLEESAEGGGESWMGEELIRIKPGTVRMLGFKDRSWTMVGDVSNMVSVTAYLRTPDVEGNWTRSTVDGSRAGGETTDQTANGPHNTIRRIRLLSAWPVAGQHSGADRFRDRGIRVSPL